VDTTHDDTAHGAHGHDEIHMPPNSWVPLSTAMSITAVFIGIIVGLWLVVIAGIWLIASLVQWYRAARSEYQHLPD
jgi:hypothetical protein